MMIENELIKNLDRLHTTEMGVNRIKKKLTLACDDVVEWCKNQIKIAGADCDKNISRKGKNWYVDIGSGIITVNAYSYTIITAHKKKNANCKDKLKTAARLWKIVRESDMGKSYSQELLEKKENK